MIRPEIDSQMQAICLRCLSKASRERYTTADELAQDLRLWLNEPVAPPKPVPIVPKGLRSYTADDSDFFIQLLPGPRDKNGLPDSIRFWKSRLESTDSQVAFSVGVLFGPSGCGKSSFVKAGLLPNLASTRVLDVYVESTAYDTEVRLFKSLRQRCPAIPDDVSLPEVFFALRTRSYAPMDKKIIVVLDQFEQWLYSTDDYQHSQLAEALRQCDGVNLQCVVMVRDDFWVATSRFLNALEVDLREGENARRIDRFELDHARKILAEFGKAYGRLPEDLGSLTKEQNAFLDEAVQDLAEDHRVICVRLSLFAEMFKSRPWTRKELAAVGGISGIGETFLEETFSSDNASPEYKVHCKAVQRVLEALLPSSGIHIRGHMRSRDELLAASNYSTRPDRFDELSRILDSDLPLSHLRIPIQGRMRLTLAQSWTIRTPRS